MLWFNYKYLFLETRYYANKKQQKYQSHPSVFSLLFTLFGSSQKREKDLVTSGGCQHCHNCHTSHSSQLFPISLRTSSYKTRQQRRRGSKASITLRPKQEGPQALANLVSSGLRNCGSRWVPQAQAFFLQDYVPGSRNLSC